MGTVLNCATALLYDLKEVTHFLPPSVPHLLNGDEKSLLLPSLFYLDGRFLMNTFYVNKCEAARSNVSHNN